MKATLNATEERYTDALLY